MKQKTHRSKKADAKKQGSNLLQYSWIAGIIYFVLSIPLFYLQLVESIKMMRGQQIEISTLFLLFFVFSVLAFVVFAAGFIKISKSLKNSMLEISTYLIIFTSIVFQTLLLVVLYTPSLEKFSLISSIIYLLACGSISIFFGVALLKTKEHLGELASATGIMNIVIGCLLLTFLLSIAGVILLFPATIMEIMLIHRASKSLTN